MSRARRGNMPPNKTNRHPMTLPFAISCTEHGPAPVRRPHPMWVIPRTQIGRPGIRRGCDRDGSRAPTLCVLADFVLGVLAIIAGLLLCFGGRFVLRLVIPIWGFFVGFGFGAGLVAGFSEDHFLGTVFGWVLGLIF